MKLLVKLEFKDVSQPVLATTALAITFANAQCLSLLKTTTNLNTKAAGARIKPF